MWVAMSTEFADMRKIEMEEREIWAFFGTIQQKLERRRLERERSIERSLSSLAFKLSMLRQAKKELDLYLSSSFNVFTHIRPNENTLSDIIADMLDPQGSHGQKDVFLREFLRITGQMHILDPEKCWVAREKHTDYIEHTRRRIDITIDLGVCGIGIENKPWAVEQPDQIKDYVEYMKKRYSDFAIVYLSREGSEPQSINEKEREKLIREKKLVIFSYGLELRDWLERCYKECKSEKFRWFLRDFIEYIDNTFTIS